MKYPRQLFRTVLVASVAACAALVYAQQLQAPQVQQQEQADPPARVGSLSQIEGTVAFAPEGESEWADAPLNRPVTAGDRLWADRGSRAEIHMGSAVLHMAGETFLDIAELDDDVVQASLNDGTVNARVRELQPGDNFEIDTPQLAFRATQPGDYRIDVDARQGITTVVVRSGAALVFGAGGQPQQLQAGQRIAFTGQNLEVVPTPAMADIGFDRWAQDRNRAEDQSQTARYVPRDVVGYQQLDTYGSWDQSADYGAVWYPRVTVADWAPYRYGHWDFITPWGWTWVDDAPWGFAPFHYGRWAQIGTRWAWVPGRLGPRPVYAPALVAFVGGNGGVSLSFGSSPGIGWFPLGPGELWRPTYRTSARYLGNMNRYVGRGGRYPSTYIHQQRPGAWTSVRVEDFNRGRPVNRSWQPVRGGDVGRAQILSQPSALPQPRRFVENNGPARARALPPPQLNAPGFAARAPRPVFQGQVVPRPPVAESRESQPQVAPAPREQQRGPREQQVQIQQQRQEQVQAQRENALRQQQQRQQVQEQRQREHDAGAARRAQPMPPPQPPQVQHQRVAPPQVQGPPPIQPQVQPQARPEGQGRGRPSIDAKGEGERERGGQGGDDQGQGQGRGRGNRGG
ncbi:MAG: DUF6600 domain-containing protein [Pseudomonadota bacterium]